MYREIRSYANSIWDDNNNNNNKEGVRYVLRINQANNYSFFRPSYRTELLLYVAIREKLPLCDNLSFKNIQ